uniref:3-oxoacyl-(Acyl-carrier-protein) synthase II, putative n=1 Tax=Arundo donax TaxID=35708 RepID=A0A0A9EZT3_ARUDO
MLIKILGMKYGLRRRKRFSMIICDASKMSEMLPIPPPIDTPVLSFFSSSKGNQFASLKASSAAQRA